MSLWEIRGGTGSHFKESPARPAPTKKAIPLGMTFLNMARPERFELPTARFVAEYSIQLSYGRLRSSALSVWDL